MARPPFQISRRISRFTGDRRAIAWLIALSMLFAGYIWIRQHPEHDPTAPIDLRGPTGWATRMKLMKLTEDGAACQAALNNADIKFRQLPAVGEGPCTLRDRIQMPAAPLSPDAPVSTCPVAAGFQLWLNTGLQQAAQQHLGARVVSIEHFGTNSCRRIGNGRASPWSEHATGNAIDIHAFVLDDGRRITVLNDWENGVRGEFLHAARDSACDSFRTVLSPDYNADHANHFHFDQGTKWSSVCR